MHRHSIIKTLALLPCCLWLACGASAVAAEEEAAYSKSGADTCLMCHGRAQEVLEIFQGNHAIPTDPRGPFGEGQLQCEACHGPGGAHTGRVKRGEERPPMIKFGSDKPTPVDVQNGACLGCHEADAGIGWHGGPHEGNDIACADCHTLHADQDRVQQVSTQAKICFECHKQQRNESLRAFAHPIDAGKMTCTGCHSPHGQNLESQLNRQTVNETCYQCHAEKRGPLLWEHAPVAEDCMNCHNPHGTNQPGMLTKRAPLLCQSCHSQAGHPSVAHDAGGLAGGTASPFLLGQSCLNCHEQVHGSNHPSGSKLMR